MCGSMTIAVASFACHSCTVCSSTCSAFAWMWLSSVRKTSRPSRAGRCWIVFTAWPSASRTTVALPGRPRRARLFSSCSRPDETRVVDARVAEHRRCDRALRVDALLVRREGEADEMALLERWPPASATPAARRRRTRGCGRRAAGTAVRNFEPEHLRRDPRLMPRIGDLHRVGDRRPSPARRSRADSRAGRRSSRARPAARSAASPASAPSRRATTPARSGATPPARRGRANVEEDDEEEQTEPRVDDARLQRPRAA